MKKITKFLTLVFMAFICLLSSCSSSSSYKTLDDIKEKGTLIVATNAEFAPFEYKEGKVLKEYGLKKYWHG